jgi:hypothetical protein
MQEKYVWLFSVFFGFGKASGTQGFSVAFTELLAATGTLVVFSSHGIFFDAGFIDFFGYGVAIITVI